MVIKYRDEMEAQEYADFWLSLGFQWCCAGGYLNAFCLPDTE